MNVLGSRDDLEKISNCDYFDWYCDMICDIRGNYFYILIKSISLMIMVWSLWRSVPNEDGS